MQYKMRLKYLRMGPKAVLQYPILKDTISKSTSAPSPSVVMMGVEMENPNPKRISELTQPASSNCLFGDEDIRWTWMKLSACGSGSARLCIYTSNTKAHIRGMESLIPIWGFFTTADCSCPISKHIAHIG